MIMKVHTILLIDAIKLNVGEPMYANEAHTLDHDSTVILCTTISNSFKNNLYADLQIQLPCKGSWNSFWSRISLIVVIPSN